MQTVMLLQHKVTGIIEWLPGSQAAESVVDTWRGSLRMKYSEKSGVVTADRELVTEPDQSILPIDLWTTQLQKQAQGGDPANLSCNG